MSHSRKLIIPALAAMSIIGFMSLAASAGPTGNENYHEDMDKPYHPLSGGSGEHVKNDPPPQSPAPVPPSTGMMKENFDFGFGHVRRRYTCFNGYQMVMVRELRECNFNYRRRAVVGGGYVYHGKRAVGGYATGGGYATSGGYNYGGGYATGGGYEYPQPIVRYYKPASRAAVMQAEKRARHAAQYNYGAGYGYDNGGYAGGGYAEGYVGGYGYSDGGYPAGYGQQMGYGDGFAGGYRHKAKRGHRRHGQVYGAVGGYGAGYGAGYGYDAGYGAGFGYGGTTIHYGPIMTKDGSY